MERIRSNSEWVDGPLSRAGPGDRSVRDGSDQELRMSKHEVVEAYLRGQIDRREFIRRLTLAGVSSAAAVAYAQSLGSASAATAPGKHGLVASYQDYPVLDSDEDGLSDAEEEELGTNA